MSLLAIARPYSPDTSIVHQTEDQDYKQTDIQNEFDFDHEIFSFLQSPCPFDYFAGSPITKPIYNDNDNEMTSAAEDYNSNNNSMVDDTEEGVVKTEMTLSNGKDGQLQEDVSVANAVPTGLDGIHTDHNSPFHMQNLSLGEGQIQIPGEDSTNIDMFPMYQPYNVSSSFPTTTPIHQYHFHPYANPRDYSNAMRSRSPVSPIRPMSPPLSASPPGSATSHHQALHNSPHLVSPMYHYTTLAETSPAGLGFHYQLPLAGTPLAYQSQAQGSALGMGSTFPYSASMMGMGQSPPLGGKAPRPRMSRGPTRSSGRKGTVAPTSIGNSSTNLGGGDDEDSDFEDGDEAPTTGLGFSPTIQAGDERIPIASKREDIRKARIESEQGADKSKRRRDELREGFRRLKEVLPQTNQRSSKSSLLDRSVAHIQALESQNKYYHGQLESAIRELEKLRNTNTELVHAVASGSASRGSSSNSPNHGHGHGYSRQ